MTVPLDWVLLPKYYLPTIGGMQTFTSRLARGLSTGGRNVNIVSKAPIVGHPALKDFILESARCRSMPADGRDHWNAVLGHLEDIPPNMAILAIGLEYESSLDNQIDALVCLRSRGHSVALRVTTTGDLESRMTAERVSKLNRLNGIFVLNTHMRAEGLSHGLDTSLLVNLPLLIDKDLFRPRSYKERAVTRKRFGLPVDGTVILWTGRLCARKQLDQLVEAWAAAGAPGTLWLVGDDEQSGRPSELHLKDLADSLGVPQPCFHPGLHPDDMYHVYSAADIFVSTSRVEGMSNSMLEAAATGLPIIGYDIPGNVDLCNHFHWHGFHMVQMADQRAIADGLSFYANCVSSHNSLSHYRELRAPFLGSFSPTSVITQLSQRMFQQ